MLSLIKYANLTSGNPSLEREGYSWCCYQAGQGISPSDPLGLPYIPLLAGEMPTILQRGNCPCWLRKVGITAMNSTKPHFYRKQMEGKETGYSVVPHQATLVLYCVYSSAQHHLHIECCLKVAVQAFEGILCVILLMLQRMNFFSNNLCCIPPPPSS